MSKRMKLVNCEETNYRRVLSFLHSLSHTHRVTESPTHSLTGEHEAPYMASRHLFTVLLPPFLHPFFHPRHAPPHAPSAVLSRRRLLLAPLRRAGEDRGVVRRAEPPRGVGGVPRVVPGAAAAAGGDGAAPVGEALQARQPRRRPEHRQGSRRVRESRSARLRTRHGRRRTHLLGERGQT